LTLALFDLDNTLLAGDSDHAWGDFLVNEGVVDAEAFRKANDEFHQQYMNGELDIQAYLQFAFRPLTENSMEKLSVLRKRFMETIIEPMVLGQGLELIRRHREEGHTLVIITATNRFVTEPIAARLGIANLIATEPEMKDGAFTGYLSGTPCFQEGKITCLEAWLETHDESADGAWFYSDSHNDLPLLKRVSQPVAVDPDTKLRAEALSSGWPIISLRSAGN